MQTDARSQREIHRLDTTRPDGIPAAYVGLATLPGSGRLVYWTGKVAVGLRYQRQAQVDIGQHAELIQSALLRSRLGRLAAAGCARQRAIDPSALRRA